MMKSFLESLQQSPTEQLQEEFLFVVQEKKSEWEISIAKTKAELARAEKNLADSYAQADLQGIIRYTSLVNNYKEGLSIIQDAFPILFPAV